MPLEHIERCAFDRAAQMRTGVIDQNVDPAEFLMHRIDESLHRTFVGNVGRNAKRAAFFRQFVYRCVKLGGVATANCNGAPLFKKRVCHCPSDTARSTGDHSDLVAKA